MKNGQKKKRRLVSSSSRSLRIGREDVQSEKEGMTVSRRFRIGKEGGRIEKKKGV